jgi:hypothetical protein
MLVNLFDEQARVQTGERRAPCGIGGGTRMSCGRPMPGENTPGITQVVCYLEEPSLC